VTSVCFWSNFSDKQFFFRSISGSLCFVLWREDVVSGLNHSLLQITQTLVVNRIISDPLCLSDQTAHPTEPCNRHSLGAFFHKYPRTRVRTIHQAQYHRWELHNICTKHKAPMCSKHTYHNQRRICKVCKPSKIHVTLSQTKPLWTNLNKLIQSYENWIQ